MEIVEKEKRTEAAENRRGEDSAEWKGVKRMKEIRGGERDGRGAAANVEIGLNPGWCSTAIHVNATPARDWRPKIFVSEADHQTRDP